MDASTLSRNDWIVVAGMALMFIAMLVAHLHVAAVIAWLLTLLATLAVSVKALPDAKLELPIPMGLLVMALGAVALVIVLFSPGASVIVGFIAAALVVFGGFLKNAEIS
jgi:uncharacterized membrane protein YhaH (DUF805 family)